MKKAAAIGLFFVGVVGLAAQEVVPSRVRAAGDRITADRLAKELAFLASDELAGRNTPSPGFDTAARYIAARLERAGLKPAGDDGTYFQHYEMHESRIDPSAATIEVNGRTFRLGDGFVIRSFAGTPTGPLPVVYVGHGWTVPDKNIDPYRGLDVAGKILLAHGPRALPKGIPIPQIGRISVGATNVVTEAARRGAAAVIFLPQASALNDWDRMRTQNLTRRELVPSVPSAYAAAPATSILLARDAAQALLEGEPALSGKDLLALGDAEDYPSSFQLSKQVRLQITPATTVQRPYNVVAILEGSDPALRNEYITIESHLDGAVGTRTVDGDSIYNSADDNATGSAATLLIAEEMMAVRPKRSLIFIWDSGEEQGLWGTRHFVGRPPVPLERIVAHFNIDMIGATRAPGSPDVDAPRVAGPNEVYLIGPKVLSASADRLLDSVNDAYVKMRFKRDFDEPDHEFFYPRTDAGPFLERGILTIGFSTGIHDRYHLPADEAKHLDPKKMEAVARTVFASVHAFGDAATIPRIDKAIPATVPNYR